MKKGSKIAVILVLVLVVLFGVGQFFASSNINNANNQSATQQPQTVATPPTQIVVYQSAQPASGTPVLNGSCFANSISAPYRTDAWRCAVGNAISDPCFMIAGSKNLLCGVNPAEGSFATSTFVLHVTKTLPAPDVAPGTPPANWAWAIQLADGTYCTPFTGTRPFTASGVAGYYGCNSPNPNESMIFGDLNASSSIWTAEVGSLIPQSSSLPAVGYTAVVPISTVWQ